MEKSKVTWAAAVLTGVAGVALMSIESGTAAPSVAVCPDGVPGPATSFDVEHSTNRLYGRRRRCGHRGGRVALRGVRGGAGRGRRARRRMRAAATSFSRATTRRACSVGWCSWAAPIPTGSAASRSTPMVTSTSSAGPMARCPARRSSISGATTRFLPEVDDPDGVLLWVRQLGSVGNDYALDIAASANGDVYVTGYTDRVTDRALGGWEGLLPGPLDTDGNLLMLTRDERIGG